MKATPPVAPEQPRLVPPPKPGYLRVAWGTLLGYALTLLLLLPVGVLLYVLGVGLDPLDTTDSIGRGLFYRDGPWSVVAEACVGLLLAGLTTTLVRSQLDRTGWETSYGVTFWTLLLAG